MKQVDPPDENAEPSERTKVGRIFIHLRERKAELERELEAVKDDISAVEFRLKELFLQDGISSDIVDEHTVHVVSDLRIQAIDGDQASVNAVLRKHGLGHIIDEKPNAITMKSIIKEYQRAAEGGDEGAQLVVDELSAVMKITEHYRLSSRKHTRSESGKKFLKKG